MPLDVETFKKYGAINRYVQNKTGGKITDEKLRALIGVEFNIMDEIAVERHFQNLILANFFYAGISGMVAAKIDWLEFDEKLKQKAKEFAELGGDTNAANM